MPKNIILLSDGTGNSAAKLAKTNVWRLYQALDLSRPEKQIAFYDDGVGSSSFKPLSIVGGAFGWGLKRNVLDLYTFLCRNYNDGDRVYCFGFSRGAFTVRSLAGLIGYEGLVSDPTDAGLLKRAKTAFREYRRKRFSADIPLDKIGRAIRDLFVGDKDYRTRKDKHPYPRIAFFGVWDTVAAYGLPIDELTRALNWFWRLYPKDREPLDKIDRLCHAVALDDERNTFHPMLFNEENEPGRNEHTKNIREERVSQVWFAGMHSNLGGGYPDDALAYVSLEWMMREAQASGILFRPKISLDSMNPAAEEKELLLLSNAGAPGKVYDSRRGLGGFYRYLPRKIADLSRDTIDKTSPVVIPRPKIHESVFHRIKEGVDRYAPIGLPLTYAVVKKNGDIVDSIEVLEHPDQAKSRVNQQEKIWDHVWRKRVVYFASIVVAGYLVTFPWHQDTTEACEGRVCVISPLINWAGALLPGFLDPWLAAYRSHPGHFAAAFVLFVGLLKIGNRIQQRIFDDMRGLWTERIQNPGTAGNVAPIPTNALFVIRTHRVYQWFFRQMKRRVLPALFAVIALVALAGTTSRLLFKSFSSFGGVCNDPAPGSSPPNTFPANSPCWAYIDPNLEIKAGKNYKITLTVGDPSKYLDNGSIKAGLGGFGREKMPWIHPAAFFFRRHLGEPWFKPIARIGETGTDEYVLSPEDGSTAGDKTYTMTSKITARREGKLYLFVNDAVLPVPNAWQRFYNNNKGAEMTVKVEPLDTAK